MQTVLLEISIKKGNKPNSYWIEEKELATGKIRPRHLGTSALNGYVIPSERRQGPLVSGFSFFDLFKRDNNLLARYSLKLGIDLGDDYNSFYQQGMRVAQQLDGKFREMSEAKYYALLESLQLKLLRELLDKKTQQRNAELEQLIADEETRQELSAQNVERVRQMIRTLRQLPFKDYSDRRPSLSHFEQRLTNIAERDENKGIRDNYWLVHPSLRADYLATIKFSPLNGLKQDYMEEDEEHLRELLAQLGAHGKTYLNAIQFEMKRDAHKGWQFFDETSYDVLQLQPEHRTFYFIVMRRAQSSGLSRYVDDIPFASARLLGKHSPEIALQVTDKAFDIIQKGGKEVEALNYIDSFLV